jgi:hypothetical protein
LHISVLLLQTVKVSLVILTLLPFQNTDVLMGFALCGAEQEQIGFAWALGIRHHDFRRDRRLHDDPLHGTAVLPPLNVGRGHGYRIGSPRDAVTALSRAAA